MGGHDLSPRVKRCPVLGYTNYLFQTMGLLNLSIQILLAQLSDYCLDKIMGAFL